MPPDVRLGLRLKSGRERHAAKLVVRLREFRPVGSRGKRHGCGGEALVAHRDQSMLLNAPLQLPDAAKRARADFVIPTGGSLQVTQATVRRVIAACMARGMSR